MTSLNRIVRDRSRNDGFSLVELLVVVAILAILAAISIPLFLNQKNKAYQATAQADGRNLAMEVTTALSDVTSWTSATTATTNTTNAWTGTTITAIGGRTSTSSPPFAGLTPALSAGSTITVVKTPSTTTWCFTVSNNGQTASYNQSGLASTC